MRRERGGTGCAAPSTPGSSPGSSPGSTRLSRSVTAISSFMQSAGYRGKHAPCRVHSEAWRIYGAAGLQDTYEACSMHYARDRVNVGTCSMAFITQGSGCRVMHASCSAHCAGNRLSIHITLCKVQNEACSMQQLQHASHMVQSEACSMRHSSHRVSVQNEACSTHGAGYRVIYAVCSRREGCRVKREAGSMHHAGCREQGEA